MSPLAIYLHFPFCRSKCTYCAFNTYTKLEYLIDPFVDALINEINIVGRSKPGQPVHTIFFGGGTPSLLKPSDVTRIMAEIGKCFVVMPNAEITLEANPNDIEPTYLAGLREAGVNRLSLGVQSTNEHELKLFARRHDNDQVAGAVLASRANAFSSLNIDLIYGIPHQSLDSWRWTLHQTLALKPDHLSLYALGLEEGTPLRDWVQQGRLPVPDEDLAADMYELAADMLANHGFVQYEISNWARPGHACRHNLQYWRNLPYIGLGPGAHGYAANMRYSTILSPKRYIDVMQNTDTDVVFPRTPATDEAAFVNRRDEISETLIMGLRLTQEGINLDTFRGRFGQDLLEIHGSVIERYTSLGLLDVDAQRVRLTEKGRLLSNTVFRELV